MKMNRANRIHFYVLEALNRGEKIALGVGGAGILGYHLANKYGVNIGHHLQGAHDSVKDAFRGVHDKIKDVFSGTTTTRTTDHSSYSGHISGATEHQKKMYDQMYQDSFRKSPS